MVLTKIPCPAGLTVQLDGYRFIHPSDSTTCTVASSTATLGPRLLGAGTPEIIVNNEKRMLRESVDALFDNGRRVAPPRVRATSSFIPLRYGAGRFGQEPARGKRVDYWVPVVVGPRCSCTSAVWPKQMA